LHTPHAADCYLGVDLGTSGVRCIAVDDAGRTLAQARTPLPDPSRSADGHSEQDPADWWEATLEALESVIGRRPGRVRALAVDATSSTVLLCDARGEPLGPALMYDDRRATREAARVSELAPPQSAAQGPGSTLAKLLHLLAHDDTGRIGFAAHQADWINGRLCGRFGISDENNALKLGYDPVDRRWPSWLSGLPLDPALLPQVVPVGSRIGMLTPAVADRLGVARDCLVIAGTTDSNAATLAAGPEHPGDAVTSLGSTLVLKILSGTPVVSARHGVYSHRIGQHWLVGGASNSGGAVLRRFFDSHQLATLSARMDPETPSALDYYPLPAVGERFPVNDPQMQPRLSPRPADDVTFLQGLLEGIARIEAEGYALLTRLGAPPLRRVFSSGGGAGNASWTGIRRRLLRVPVEPAAHTEAAYGTALIARHGWNGRPL
jgi:sugar (pentulose or hexulose) kinase